MASRIIVIILVVLLGAGLLLAFGSIPTSAFNGGQPVTICNLNMTVAGVYNDYLVSHSISNFEFTAGATGCHQQTLLDLFPASASGDNLFPFGLTFSVVLTASDGSVHGPYQIQATIPAGQISYPFNVGTTAANFHSGTYSVSVTCPISCTSSGGQIYTTQISV